MKAARSIVRRPVSATIGRFGLRSGILLLAAATSAAAQTGETLLEAGTFAARDVACRQAGPEDVLISNGHAVAPPGQSCRVISRTSMGSYYPLFNETCSGSGDAKAVLKIEDRHTVSFAIAGQASRSYRFCPSAEARSGQAVH